MPSGKFEYCTLDFMTELPEVNGYNALLVIMDKFGKPFRLVEGTKVFMLSAMFEYLL